MHDFDLIDLKTYVRLREAAPQVTVVPADIARDVLEAMKEFSNLEEREYWHLDIHDRLYYQIPLKIIRFYSNNGNDRNVPLMMYGKACREMGLVMVRKSSGYYVAWSQDQFDILEDYFKHEVEA